jgi:hypothetical protein
MTYMEEIQKKLQEIALASAVRGAMETVEGMVCGDDGKNGGTAEASKNVSTCGETPVVCMSSPPLTTAVPMMDGSNSKMLLLSRGTQEVPLPV